MKIVDLFENVGVVVNYYWKSSFPTSSRFSTLVSLLSLLEAGFKENIILVDGSPIHDPFIEEHCENLGIRSIHTDSNLTFAEGYNLGIEHSKGEYICLMANDIYPTRDAFEKLYKWISLPDVGCVFPYLSSSDYPGQIPSFVRKPITCEPTCMTLNINLFRRSVLEEIGGLDVDFSGGYNDIVTLTSIRSLGYKVILVGDTNVTHLGRMTISHGSNYVISKNDYEIFINKFPHLQAKHGKWGYKHWVKPFAMNKKVALSWWLCQNIPSTRVRKYLEREIIRLEPELTKC